MELSALSARLCRQELDIRVHCVVFCTPCRSQDTANSSHGFCTLSPGIEESLAFRPTGRTSRLRQTQARVLVRKTASGSAVCAQASLRLQLLRTPPSRANAVLTGTGQGPAIRIALKKKGDFPMQSPLVIIDIQPKQGCSRRCGPLA